MVGSKVSDHTQQLLDQTLVWDNHACMPLRPGDDSFLPQLQRCKAAGINIVFLNVTYDLYPWETGFKMLATFRHWLSLYSDDYVMIDTLADIEQAKANNKLAIAFDIEGGKAVEEHPGLVEVFYKLGVRWMLIAYNKNNKLGGGCLDDDTGLTDYGRQIIDEMERVGMVLCCSHTGYRTAREAIDYARNPVIFSHSNPRKVYDHDRNIPDELMLACAQSGGVVNINGIGIFLGKNDNATETLLRHIDYASNLIGPEHVGLGLDYVFDAAELNAHVSSHSDMFPSEKGYTKRVAMVEPERFPAIAEGLLTLGYSDDHIKGILGHNNLRVARTVWK